MIYTAGFWTLAVILPAISVNVYYSKAWTTIAVQYAMLPVLVVVSWLFSRKNSFTEWFDIMFFAGARKISKHMTLLSSEEEPWWGLAFKYWW